MMLYQSHMFSWYQMCQQAATVSRESAKPSMSQYALISTACDSRQIQHPKP
jgi:hypothetical protein